MRWQTIPYLAPLLISTCIAVLVVDYARRRRGVPGIRPFCILMLAVVVWSLAYAFELAAGALEAKVMSAKVEYVGIVTIPLAWFVFVLDYTGLGHYLSRRTLFLLALEPLITLVLFWTNEAHGLMWADMWLKPIGPFLVLEKQYGIWFWANAAYSYLLLFLGSVVLLQSAFRLRRLYRKQAVALLIAALLPCLANVAHLFGLTPVSSVDPTPFVFVLSGLLAAVLFRFRFLNSSLGIIPTAHDITIQKMQDGVIVLDERSRIVDWNPAVERILGCGPEALRDQLVEQVLAQLPDQGTSLLGGRQIAGGVFIGEGMARRCYDVLALPLHHERGHLAGGLVVLRDITDRKRAEETRHFLAEVSLCLASSLDYEVTLERVAQLAVPRLGDWCVVDTLEDDGRMRRVAAVHVEPDRETHAREILHQYPPDPNNHPVSRVLRTGRSECGAISDSLLAALANNDRHLHHLRELNPRSYVITPLVTRGRILGAMSLISREQDRYQSSDLALVEDLAHRAALAVDNARLYREAQIEIGMRERAEEALRESGERLRLAVEAGRLGTWEWNVLTGEILWSRHTKAIHGLGSVRFGGTIAAFLENTHPHDRESVARTIWKAVEQRARLEIEYRVVWPDGTVHWIEARGRVSCDSSGRPLRMRGVCADITERKQAEEERARLTSLIEQERATLKAVMESMGDGLMVMDSSRQIRYCNERAADLLRISSQLLVDKRDEDVFALLRETLRDPATVWDTWRRGLSSLTERPSFEVSHVGSPRQDIQIQLFPVATSNGTNRGIGVLLRDINGVQLLAKLEERERIAMELHDSVIQSLYGAMLALAAHERTLSHVGRATHDALHQVKGQINDIIKDVRNYIFDLQVHELGICGLKAGLAVLAEELRVNALVCPKLIIETDAEGILSAEATYHVLQIVREATSNVIRHAHASEAIVRLAREDERIVLSIRDNGRGFDPHADGAWLGQGLNNMRRRADMLGGHLTVISAPGNGADIRLEVPLCLEDGTR